MRKVIVAAKSKNNVIGVDDDLAWSMPADLKHYHDLVRGGWVMMGRTTYESNYEPIPVKQTIVITRKKDYITEDSAVKVVNSLEASFDYAKRYLQKKIFILGGGNIYEQAISLADEMIITEIDVEVEGDTYFPKIDLKEWDILEKLQYKADKNNPHDYAFVFYRRKSKK